MSVIEVLFLLRKISISNGLHSIFFNSNEVASDLLNMSKFILVDHHVPTPLISTLNQSHQESRILAIFDHRPLDMKNAKMSNFHEVKLNEVGSCATLIVDEIRNLEHSLGSHPELVSFLSGPIVLDNMNFSDSAVKAKPLDVDIYGEIERILHSTEADRLNFYNELIKARSDISSLSPMQLLSKDLKIISNNDGSYVVAFPGFPLLVEVLNVTLPFELNLSASILFNKIVFLH